MNIILMLEKLMWDLFMHILIKKRSLKENLLLHVGLALGLGSNNFLRQMHEPRVT